MRGDGVVIFVGLGRMYESDKRWDLCGSGGGGAGGGRNGRKGGDGGGDGWRGQLADGRAVGRAQSGWREGWEGLIIRGREGYEEVQLSSALAACAAWLFGI